MWSEGDARTIRLDRTALVAKHQNPEAAASAAMTDLGYSEVIAPAARLFIERRTEDSILSMM
ncbi:hypothetical protein GCM10009858_01110 [Terrabacter carboxydivorans]|uniref:Uncharacterized protein n=1 Tax=Terrabacter carboxydivorans TaxID=619730 RepID=A0ABN3KRC5_9MICO